MLKIFVGPLLVMLSGVTAAYAVPYATAVCPKPHPASAAAAELRCVAAPEIDPSSAVSAITLLLGGLVVLRGHGRAKREGTVT